MPKYVAFLRAINVGGTSVIKMEALRGLFEDLGFTNVKTVIASGNVLFEARAAEGPVTRAIEKTLGTHLGREAKAFVRTIDEVRSIAELKPFPRAELEADGNEVHVAFLEREPGAEATERLMALANPIDEFRVHGAEAYWLRRRKVGESKLAANFLEKALGLKATVRNAKTIRRIAAM
jgi:uncharacterized protein (DUF1697 family)